MLYYAAENINKQPGEPAIRMVELHDVTDV